MIEHYLLKLFILKCIHIHIFKNSTLMETTNKFQRLTCSSQTVLADRLTWLGNSDFVSPKVKFHYLLPEFEPFFHVVISQCIGCSPTFTVHFLWPTLTKCYGVSFTDGCHLQPLQRLTIHPNLLYFYLSLGKEFWGIPSVVFLRVRPLVNTAKFLL